MKERIGARLRTALVLRKILLFLLLLQTLALLVVFIPGVAQSADYILRDRIYHLARRWKGDDYFDRVTFIVAQTPDDSLIVLPPLANSFGAIGNTGLTDFFVYPRHAAHREDARLATWQGPVYWVQVKDFVAPTRISQTELDPSFSLAQVRPRQSIIPTPERDFISIPTGPGNGLLAAIKLGLIALTGGFFVVRWFPLRTLLGTIAAALLVGMTTQTVLFIGLSVMGVPASNELQLSLLVLTAVPAVVWMVRHPPRLAWNRERATWLATGVTIAVLAGIFLIGIAKPIVEWDAAAIWGIKARLIFSFDSLRPLWEWGAYPEYPPLVPIAMAQLGVGGERAAKALFPIFTLCLYGVLYEGIAPTRLPRALQLLAPLPLLLVPQILEHTQSGYANLALAVYVTLAVMLLARGLYENNRALLVATAFVLCGVVLVRPDGEVYAGYMILIAVLWSIRNRRAWWGFMVLALPIAVDVAWKLFYRIYLRTDASPSLGIAPQGLQMVRLMLTSLPTPGNLGRVGWYLLNYMLGVGYWGLFPVLFLVLLLAAPRAIVRRYPVECVFIGLSVVGLSVLALYLAPAWGLDYFFNATYLRLYMVVVPLMYVLMIRELAHVLTVQTVPSVSATEGAAA